jgi:predicted dehydrogenase
VAGDGFGVVQIGAGGAGMAHMRAVSAHPDCRLVAAADVAEPARSAAAAAFEVPVYADYRDMLDRHAKDASIAIVVVPHHIYPDAIEAVVDAGLHILKEKPFARSLQDADRMQTALRGHDRVFMTAGQRFFAPAYRAALERAADGSLGDIYLAQGRITYAWRPDGQGWGWRGDRALSGGTAILDAGWHLLEALHAFQGQPDRVYAVSGGMRASAGDWTTDDKGALTLEYPNGSVATAVACHVALPDQFEVLLHGTRGNLELTTARMVRYDRNAVVESQDWAGVDLFAAQLDHFLDCVRGAGKPAFGLDVSMDLQRVVDAAYRSAATRLPIELAPRT